MTEPGKNAPGLKGFPTPNAASEEAAYLLMRFQDKTWAQYALGALKALTVGYNWYESGDLDVDEAAEAFRIIVQDAPYNKLPSCSLPTGQPLMRIDPTTGHIQTVDDDGNWQDNPDIPPTPARPPATPEEMRCLAAANTANALKILYENLTDSWSMGLSTAEAITAFLTAVGTTLSAVFFPPAEALIAIGGLLFEVVYEVVAFLGADVWSEEFDGALQCYLFDCASVDEEDVVTYDFQCVIDNLAAGTNPFDLSANEIRLFGQLYYILNFIGVDGLNYAGSATAIETADCSDCALNWCYNFQAMSRLEDWTPLSWDGEPLATWTGTRWEETGVGSSKLWISWVFSGDPVVLTDASILTYFSGSGNIQIWVNGTGAYPDGGTRIWVNGHIDGTPFPITVTRIDASIAWAFNTTTLWISEQQYSGTGENPFGDDNCE